MSALQLREGLGELALAAQLVAEVAVRRGKIRGQLDGLAMRGDGSRDVPALAQGVAEIGLTDRNAWHQVGELFELSGGLRRPILLHGNQAQVVVGVGGFRIEGDDATAGRGGALPVALVEERPAERQFSPGVPPAGRGVLLVGLLQSGLRGEIFRPRSRPGLRA